MSTAQMKKTIINEVNKADEALVKSIYSVLKVAKQQHSSPSFAELTSDQKQKIEIGLQQLKNGKGKNVITITNSLAKKYDIKG
jgi:translation initiation factor 1 (eIF-1/SUI1)